MYKFNKIAVKTGFRLTQGRHSVRATVMGTMASALNMDETINAHLEDPDADII